MESFVDMPVYTHSITKISLVAIPSKWLYGTIWM